MNGDPNGPRRTPPRTAPDIARHGDPRAARPDPTRRHDGAAAAERDGAGRWRKGMGVEPT